MNSSSPPLTPNPALACDLVADLLREEDMSRIARAEGRSPGPRTGFEALDRELGGFLAPGVHTILAAPGAGKTSLCSQIGAACGYPALYVSAEMRRVEMLRRLIARETGEFLGKLRGGQLDGEKLRALARRAVEKTPQLALFDAQEAVSSPEGGGASPNAIAARAAALKQRFNSDHVLVIIDSVTEWAPLALSSSDGASLNEYAIAEAAVNGLKNLASVLNCPVLAIAHRHRAAQGKEADRLHGAKGTGRFEYVSESVWDMERDSKNQPPRAGCAYVDLTLVKNRHGSVGSTIRLFFDGPIQKFSVV
jgi:replicative DNA helicase